MSRIGKQVIEIPNGVEVSVNDGLVKVKSSKGELQHQMAKEVSVHIENNSVSFTVQNPNDHRENVLWGTNASLVKNMIEGVSQGYSKTLEINGVGFKVALSGNKLNMSLGFSHPVVYELPQGIQAEVEKNVVKISGIDKQLVGQVAAQIRALKKPEPYKGKGIKYTDEVIRRKAGKAAAGGE